MILVGIRVWKQRYFVNTDFYKPNGSIFLYIEGESEIRANCMLRSNWINIAKEFGAFVFRFRASFLWEKPSHYVIAKIYVNTKRKVSNSTNICDITCHKYLQWIIFGESYAGSLIAWTRTKYPHLVHEAISTSAPLLAQIGI